MKKLHNELDNVIDKIERKYDERRNYWYDKSEAWQESDKGLEHETTTDDLEMILCELREKRDELLDWIESN